MRRLLGVFLACALLLASFSAVAEPLTVVGESSGQVNYPEDSTPETAQYIYRYSYPLLDATSAEAGMINDFYAYLVSDALDFTAPIAFESLESTEVQAYTAVTSQVTCNNDAYFSVLVTTESFMGAEASQTLSGHTFARTGSKAGSCISLPYLLGLLDPSEGDTWMQDRAAAKANTFIYDLVWEIIEQQLADGNVAYYDTLTREDLETQFYPEEDFYLDENGDPVFYIQASLIASNAEGVLTFPFALAELLDEL